MVLKFFFVGVLVYTSPFSSSFFTSSAREAGVSIDHVSIYVLEDRVQLVEGFLGLLQVISFFAHFFTSGVEL